MLRLVLRGALLRRGRLALVAAALVLAVALVSGTLVLSRSVRHSYDTLLAQVTSGIDVYVRGPETDNRQGISDFAPVPDARLATVRAVPGVAAAQGQVVRLGQLVAVDGTFLGRGGPTYAFSWPAIPRLSPFDLVQGRAPAAPGEVVVDAATAQAAHLRVGDTVRVSVDVVSPRSATVVGLVAARGRVDLTGSAAVFLSSGWVQTLTGIGSRWDLLEVAAEPGIGADALRARIAAVLPDDASSAITSRDYADAQVQNLSSRSNSVTTLLLALSLLSVLVGGAVVLTTMGVVVSQRARELAQLRMLGMSRRQVYASILGETLVIGLPAAVAGALLGIPASLALRALVVAAGEDASGAVLEVDWGLLALIAVVAAVAAVVVAAIPARRATRAAPMAAMRDDGGPPPTPPRRATLLLAGCLLAAAAGSVVIAAGLRGTPTTRLPLVSIGGGLLAVALLAGIPRAASPALRVLAATAARTGSAGAVARTALLRTPRRAAGPAAALAIGIGLITCVSLLASSERASLTDLVRRADRSDLVVTSDTAPGIDVEAVSTLRTAPGVAAVTEVGAESFTVDGRSDLVTAIDPQTAPVALALTAVDGSLDGFADGGIAVTRTEAQRDGYRLGSRVSARFGIAQTRSLRVVAVIADNGITRDWVIPIETYRTGYRVATIRAVFVRAAPGTTAPELDRRVRAGVAGFPGIQVKDPEAYAQQQAQDVERPVALVEALVALAIVIALLWSMNTLALSVVERRREIGLLRVVGMTRGQVSLSVEWEAGLVAILGVLSGLAVGGLLGLALVTALRDSGVTEVVVPAGRLLVAALLVVVGALAAAVLPARRAVRLEMSEALAE